MFKNLWLGVAFAGLLLTGCIQTDIVVEVKPDGSGTLTEKIVVTPYLEETMAQMMGQMMGMGGGTATSNKKDSKKSIVKVDKESGLKMAQTMGEGVTWVSSKPLKTKEGEGAIVVFKFQDINKLNGIDMNPLSTAGLKQSQEDKAVVQLTKEGNESVLILTRKKAEEEPVAEAMPVDPQPEAVDSAVSAEPLPSMEQLNPFRGLRAKVAFKIVGKITKTNATLRKGNEITVLDMDFDKLLAAAQDTTLMRKLSNIPDNVSSATKHFGLVPGMAGDTNDTLQIRFTK